MRRGISLFDDRDDRDVLVRKTITKEKTDHSGWGRASRASSVSSITEPLTYSRQPSRRGRSHSRHYYHVDCTEHKHRCQRAPSRSRQQSGRGRTFYVEERPHKHRRRHKEGGHSRSRSRSFLSSSAPTPSPKHKPSPPVKEKSGKRNKVAPRISLPSQLPVLIVPISTAKKMDDQGSLGNWYKKREVVKTDSIAPKSSISNQSSHSEMSDQDNAYHYISMREPGPQDAFPVAYAMYPQPGYTYLFPQQQQQQAPMSPPFLPMASGALPAVAAPKPEEASYHHYVAERVREKSVHAAPSSPPAQQPTMPMPFFQGYPAAPMPVAYAMPNYPVPVQPEAAPKPPKERTWVGRTKKEVDQDNAKIAHREGVYEPNPIMPKGAKPDQLFWVSELDHSNTLRTFRTIEEDLQPGRWKIDPRYGNAYFVRDKPEKK